MIVSDTIWFMSNQKYGYYYNTPVGRIGIAEVNENVTDLFFSNMPAPEGMKTQETELTRGTYAQVCEYLNRQRMQFYLPIDFPGEGIEYDIYRFLFDRITYDKTIRYNELSEIFDIHIRSIAAILKKNPIAIIIPTHRVLASNGKVCNFVGGTDLKSRLLEMEHEVQRDYKGYLLRKPYRFVPYEDWCSDIYVKG